MRKDRESAEEEERGKKKQHKDSVLESETRLKQEERKGKKHNVAFSADPNKRL